MRALPYKRLLDKHGNLISQGIFQGQALVSFGYDDGYLNNYTIALPLHEQYAIPATFFIVTDWVNTDIRYAPTMTTSHLLDLQSKGYEIGAHSKTHTYYEGGSAYKGWANLSREELDYEIGESKNQLEAWGLRVRGFAAPFYHRITHNDLYRKHGLRYNRVGTKKLETYPPGHIYELPSYVNTAKDVSVAAVKQAVDEAIQEKKWIIITMHHVIETLDDTDVTSNTSYYWLAEQLDELLSYISSKPKEQLYPTTIYEGFVHSTNYK